MLNTGHVVKSIAGHDKDRFYVVVKAEKDRVYIADGKARKLAKPKAKNILHIRKTNTVLDPGVLKTDKQLRLALRAFGPAGEEGGC